MDVWYIILSAVLLLVVVLTLIFCIIKLKRATEKPSNQNRADINKLLRKRYRTVCIIAAMLVIIFVTAFCVLVISKNVAVSMAMIISAVILAGVAGFCGGKILFSD